MSKNNQKPKLKPSQQNKTKYPKKLSYDEQLFIKIFLYIFEVVC